MNLQLALNAFNDLNQLLNDYRSDENFKEILEILKLIPAKFDVKSVFLSRRPLR